MLEIAVAYVLGFGGGVFVGLIAAMRLIRTPADGVSVRGRQVFPCPDADDRE